MMSERSAAECGLLPEKASARRSVDVAIIGAGQVGLAVGSAIAETELSFVVLDGASKVGDSWRNRYDSLRLFSPRSLSSLPGRPLAGDQDGYPDKDEIADYLERYADAFRLPVKLGQRVTSLRRSNGGFRIEARSGATWLADAVVVASGAFQRSIRPAFSSGLAPEVQQLDPTSYRSPLDVPEGPVLVVGGGATGRQIARELSRTHEVSLSCGGRVSITPHRLLGKDAMWWAKLSGLLTADKDSFKGRFARRHDSFPGRELTDASLRRKGVTILGRATSAEGSTVHFSSGVSQSFRCVIWCVGYQDDTSWIHIEDALNDGAIVQERGESSVPGLYYAGRSWQNFRASALLCGAGMEADFIVARVRNYLSVQSR